MTTHTHDTSTDVGSHDSHGHVDPLKAYWIVFLALMALLGLTLAAYMIPFERMHPFGWDIGYMNTVVALIIASVKAMMVVLVFMHLRHSTRLTWVVASAGFVWLCIMIFFTFADYLSRGAVPENNGPAFPRSAVVEQSEPKQLVETTGW